MNRRREHNLDSGPNLLIRWGMCFAGSFLVWVLVFSAPWHWPVGGPVDSQSYVFGFNNAAAQVGLAFCFFIFFLVRLRWDKLQAADQAFIQRIFAAPPQLPRRHLLILLLCLFGSVGIVGGYWWWLPFSYYGEATYFLTRLDMISLGFFPFREFNFGYGPAMLWIPYFLSQLSWGWLTTDSAYLLTHLSFYVLGLLALNSILRKFDLSAGHHGALLILGTFASLNIMLGIQYAPLRFFFPLWAAMTLPAALLAGPRHAWMAAFGLPLAGFLIGPEVGLITTILALAGIIRKQTNQPHFRRYALGPLLALALPSALFGSDYFKMIFFFGGGAGNFPLLPAPYLIALLAVACWILPKLAVGGWDSSLPHSVYAVSTLFALGMFLPAALGRCDPGHVLHNGLGMFLFAIIAAVRSGGLKKAAPVYLCFFVALATDKASFWNHYQQSIASAQATQQLIQRHQAELEKGHQIVMSRVSSITNPRPFRWDKQLPFSPDLLMLLPYSKLAVLRGADEDLDRFLKVSGLYFPEYYVPPYEGTFTPASLEEKLERLRGAPYLLIPENYLGHLNGLAPDLYAEGWSDFLSKLFLFPVHLRAKNPPFDQDLLTARFVEKNFRQVDKFRNMLVMERR